jgi:MFS family permease
MTGIGILMMASGIYGNYGIAGALTAADVVAWAIGTAFLSNLVDRFGQRRIMLPAALVSAAALAIVVILAVFHAPLWTLFVFTVISGLTQGSPGAMVRARWNYVLSSAHDLHTAYSLESTLDELGFIIGPVAATWLATSLHPAAGLAGPALMIAGGAGVFYSLKSTEPTIITREHSHSHSRLIILLPGIAVVDAIGFLMGALFGSIDVATLAATTTWNSREQVGIVLGVMSLGSAIGGFLYGARSWRSPLWKRFLICVSLLGVTAWILYFAWNPLTLGIFGFIVGFSIAPTFINANGLIGYLVPPARLTEGLAWLGTAIGIGVSIGSAISGYLIDHFGHGAGFICVMVGGVLALSVALGASKQLKILTEAKSLGALGEDE